MRESLEKEERLCAAEADPTFLRGLTLVRGESAAELTEVAPGNPVRRLSSGPAGRIRRAKRATDSAAFRHELGQPIAIVEGCRDGTGTATSGETAAKHASPVESATRGNAPLMVRAVLLVVHHRSRRHRCCW